MSDLKTLKDYRTRRFPVLNPPDDVAIMVGRIIAHWSFQVWLLQQCTYTLLGVGDRQGRIAVRDPRPDEHVQMIQQLMSLVGFKTDLDLAGLIIDLKSLKGLRDNVAHGVWTENVQTGQITLSIDSGNWVIPGTKHGKVSRRVVPEARCVNRQGLETVRAAIEECITVTQQLLASLEKQAAASNEKHPPPRPSAHHADDPNSNTP